MRKNKRAQSTLEYIVMLTAIVAGILYAGANLIKPAVQNSLNYAGFALENEANKINWQSSE